MAWTSLPRFQCSGVDVWCLECECWSVLWSGRTIHAKFSFNVRVLTHRCLSHANANAAVCRSSSLHFISSFRFPDHTEALCLHMIAMFPVVYPSLQPITSLHCLFSMRFATMKETSLASARIEDGIRRIAIGGHLANTSMLDTEALLENDRYLICNPGRFNTPHHPSPVSGNGNRCMSNNAQASAHHMNDRP